MLKNEKILNKFMYMVGRRGGGGGGGGGVNIHPPPPYRFRYKMTCWDHGLMKEISVSCLSVITSMSLMGLGFERKGERGYRINTQTKRYEIKC